MFDGVPRKLYSGLVPIPSPGDGEWLVRVVAMTICGSDRHTWEGRRQGATPTVLGHEMIGEIVVRGRGCPSSDCRGRRLDVGSRVTWAIVAACGACSPCRGEIPQKCDSGVKYGHERAIGRRVLTGGLAEYCLLAPGTSLVVLDEDLPISVACPANCATATVAAAIAACGELHCKRLGIVGAGMLGLTACAIAEASGARVIVAEPDAGRRRRASSFGASAALDPTAWTAEMAGSLDAVIEVSGTNGGFLAALPTLRVGGRMILVGAVAPSDDVAVSLEGIVRRCLTIRGVHNYGPGDLVAAVQFLERNHRRYPFSELVSEWFPLAEVDAAFAAAADPAHVRVGVKP
jgi:putative phosphonate catabolism associated alcohol dehydrogenase